MPPLGTGCRWPTAVLTIALGLATGADIAAGEGVNAMTQVYADTDWYRARAEPEEQWQGVLREHQAPIGPAGRTTQRYMLVTPDGPIPVYAPPPSPALDRLAGRSVAVRGKLVDLTGVGLGRELWIGSIEQRTNP